jgi:hypothetical protein
LNSYSKSYFTFSNRSIVGLYSVANSNLFFGFSSYYFLIVSVFILLLSSFSFSISTNDFLNKCFGIGFACFSYAKAIGCYITLGFGFVRLKGYGSVIFFYLISPSSGVPYRDKVLPPVYFSTVP